MERSTSVFHSTSFFSSPLPSRPPPVKPSDNSGTDRLATNKEGAGGKEGEFDLFFERHKIPPAVFLSPCLFPLHKSIYNPPISFSLIEHLTLEKKPHQAGSPGTLTEMDSMLRRRGIRQPVFMYNLSSVLFLP